VIATQSALVAAVQVQSRVVVIATVLDIPAAGAVRPFSLSTSTSHFAVVGAVVENDVDEPVQAAARSRHAHNPNSRARTARHGAIRLPNRLRSARIGSSVIIRALTHADGCRVAIIDWFDAQLLGMIANH
jgi:hypothetical protein